MPLLTTTSATLLKTSANLMLQSNVTGAASQRAATTGPGTTCSTQFTFTPTTTPGASQKNTDVGMKSSPNRLRLPTRNITTVAPRNDPSTSPTSLPIFANIRWADSSSRSLPTTNASITESSAIPTSATPTHSPT